MSPTRDPDPTLREEARSLLASGQLPARDWSQTDIPALLHEMQVYHAELDIQAQNLREAQESLERSRDQFRQLYDFAPVGYLSLNRDGVVLRCNLTACELTRMSLADLEGRRLLRLLHPESRYRFTRHLLRIFDTHEPHAIDICLTSSDRQERWLRLESRFLAAEHDDAAPQGIALTAVIDISRRIHAETELGNKLAFLKTLLNAIPSPVFIKNTQLRYLSGNTAFGNLVGCSIAAIESQRECDPIPETDRTTYNRGDLNLLCRCGTDRYSAIIHDRSGHPKNVVFHKATFEESPGVIGGIVGIIIDMTKQRQAEEAMIRNERLAAAGILAGGVAHEFNNLNGAILGFVELMLGSSTLDDKNLRRLRLIQSSVVRATDITRNLLTFARQDKPCKHLIELKTTVENTLRIFRHELRNQGIQLQTIHEECPPLIADDGQIGQIVMNLSINAAHAMSESSAKKLTIRTGCENDSAIIEVTDTGCGIAEEDRNRLFVPFFTTKGEHAKTGSSHARLQGTGLGLSICETVVHDHGGTIDFESIVGSGTTFRVRIPLGNPSDAPAQPDTEEAEEHARLPGRILVLDDEAMIREVLHDILEQAGHTVDETDDGNAALQMIARKQFDIVLVDLQMPKVSGGEFIRTLQQRDLPNRPAVMVCTGKLIGNTPEECAGLEIADILAKPFDWPHVLRSIQSVLQKRAASE